MIKEKDPNKLLDLLLSFEFLEDKEKAQIHLSDFLLNNGFKTTLKHAESYVFLTIYNQKTAISLFWQPSKNHYCPNLQGITDKQLTGVSIDNYSIIWKAFNAYINAAWQLPKLHKSILGALSQGRNIEDIAKDNNLSIPSIKRYLKIIRQNLGARTNSQAVCIALRNHWF